MQATMVIKGSVSTAVKAMQENLHRRDVQILRVDQEKVKRSPYNGELVLLSTSIAMVKVPDEECDDLVASLCEWYGVATDAPFPHGTLLYWSVPE